MRVLCLDCFTHVSPRHVCPKQKEREFNAKIAALVEEFKKPVAMYYMQPRDYSWWWSPRVTDGAKEPLTREQCERSGLIPKGAIDTLFSPEKK